MINRRLTNNRWLVVVVACATLAAGASFAEERGGKSDEAAPSGRPSDSGGAANKASTGGQNSGLAGNRSDAGGATLRAPTTDGRAASGRAAGEGGFGSRGTASGGKATAAPGGIDLIRPDDGYSSLRRAARSSPIAAGQKKSPPIVSTVTVVPHQRSLAPALGEPVRNSTGATIARTTSGPAKTDSIHTVSGVPGGIGISKTHITAMAPVTGINGTNMGHAGAGGVGGPSLLRCGLNPSVFPTGFRGQPESP
jgi:hypothetical protein